MKVRTTMQPDREIEVTEHEAGELRALGLLIEDRKPSPSSRPKPADETSYFDLKK
jgi:hypothetical protein